MAARLRSRRDQPKSGRRNVARNYKIARFGDLIAENADGVVLAFDSADQKIIEHQLGVIAAGERFVDGGLAFSEKTGEQNGALDLRACDRRSIMNSAQRSATDTQRRSLLRTFGDNVRAHFPKRFNHAIHRPAIERSVSDQPRFESLTGEQPGEETHGRARTATIDFSTRWRKEALLAVNNQNVRLGMFDLDPERPQSADGVHAIVARQKTAQCANAV